jgi:hypothetical protein
MTDLITIGLPRQYGYAWSVSPHSNLLTWIQLRNPRNNSHLRHLFLAWLSRLILPPPRPGPAPEPICTTINVFPAFRNSFRKGCKRKRSLPLQLHPTVPWQLRRESHRRSRFYARCRLEISARKCHARRAMVHS